MENYKIILYKSYYICYSPTNLNRLQRSTKKNQYYQASDKTFRKTTIIAHAHHANITLNECTEKNNYYPVPHEPH